MAIPAIQNNTPAPGNISWAAFTIQLYGVAYSVPAASTPERWVWWKYNNGVPSINAGPDVPATLTDDDLVLFANKNGIGVRVQSTSFVDGELLVDGSIFAEALSTNLINSQHIVTAGLDAGVIKFGTMSGDRIAANTITSNQIGAGAITTEALAAGAVTAQTLAAGAVTANAIAAGAITAEAIASGTMTAEILLSGKIQTDVDNTKRVEMDSLGLRLYSSLEKLLVDLPTDPGKSAQFNGDATLSSVNINGGLTISDPNPGDPNSVAATVDVGAEIMMSAGLAPPPAPSVSAVYDSAPDLNVGYARGATAVSSNEGVAVSGTDLIFDMYDSGAIGRPLGARGVYKVPMDGSAAATMVYDRSDSNPRVYPYVDKSGGVTVMGAYAYWLYCEKLDVSNYRWKVRRWNVADGSGAVTYSMGSGNENTDTGGGAESVWKHADNIRISSDGTNIWIAREHGDPSFTTGDPAATYKLYAFDEALVARPTASYAFPAFGGNEYLAGYLVTAADFGGTTPRHILRVGNVNGTESLRIYTISGTTLTRQTDLEWPLYTRGSIFWTGSEFRQFSRQGTYILTGNTSVIKVAKYTALTWTSATSSKWWVSQAWRDGSATPKSSAQSGRSGITMVKRAKLKMVSNADIPVTYGADRLMFYVGIGTNDPGRTAMYDQGAVPVGDLSQSISARATGTTVPPAASTFTSASPGRVISEGKDALSVPIIQLKGDGAGRVGPLSWDANGVALTGIDDTGWVNFNVTAGDSTFFPGTGKNWAMYRRFGPMVHLRISKDMTGTRDVSGATSGDFGNLNVFGDNSIPAAVRPMGALLGAGRMGSDSPVQVSATTTGSVVWVGGLPRNYATAGPQLQADFFYMIA